MSLLFSLLLLLPQVSDTPAAAPKIVAIVGETTITKRAVDFLIAQRVRGIFAGQADSLATFNAARQHLIDQAVVLNYLESRSRAEPSSVADETIKLERQLARSGQTLEQWLDQQNRHRQDLEFEIRWRQHWSLYVDNLLSDSLQRERAFQRWGFHFDGSQVEAAQILLTVDSTNQQAQLKLADEIHARLIRNGNVTDEQWKVEVLAHSQSPNRSDEKRPGYCGKIEYRYPMPERFSKSCFSLKAGEISTPFQTGLGIHIVRLLSHHQGSRTIDQCKDELDRTMKREAFHAILDRHRKNVSVSVP